MKECPLTFVRAFVIAAVLGVMPLHAAVLTADEIIYDSGGRRNPFIPLIGAGSESKSSPQVKSSDLIVDGIIYDPSGGSIAVIKGESYREGSQINNITVVSILRDRVILKQNDAEKVLWIREEVVDNKSGKK